MKKKRPEEKIVRNYHLSQLFFSLKFLYLGLLKNSEDSERTLIKSLYEFGNFVEHENDFKKISIFLLIGSFGV